MHIVKDCPLEILPILNNLNDSIKIATIIHQPIYRCKDDTENIAKSIKEIELSDKQSTILHLWREHTEHQKFKTLYPLLLEKYSKNIQIPSEKELKELANDVEPPMITIKLPLDVLPLENDALTPELRLRIPFPLSYDFYQLPDYISLGHLSNLWSLALLENYHDLPPQIKQWIKEKVDELIKEKPELAEIFLKYYPYVMDSCNLASLL
jgi:hypothetical protein